MLLRRFALLVSILCAHALCARGQIAQGPTLFVGDRAPALTIETWVKGTKIGELDPDKTYVVDFWATWVATCKTTIPQLNALAAKYREKGIEFVGISICEREADKVEPFVAQMGDAMTYAVGIDTPKVVAEGQVGRTGLAWLVAAGRESIPTAFIVHKSRIAWIGLTVKIEEPLAAIAAGTFDLEAAAKAYRATLTIDREHRTLVAVVAARVQKQEFAEALAEIDGALMTSPALEPLVAADRFMILLLKGDHSSAAAYGTKIVDGCLKDDAQQLNQVAWTIVEPTSKVDRGMRNLVLARKAAERAIELTKAEDWGILDTLALVCFDQGEVERALELQEKAVKLSAGAAAAQIDPMMRERLEQFRKAVAAKKAGG